jgi:hypothetical protein
MILKSIPKTQGGRTAALNGATGGRAPNYYPDLNPVRLGTLISKEFLLTWWAVSPCRRGPPGQHCGRGGL